MRLFDLLVAKKLSSGSAPTTDYQFAGNSSGTVAGVPSMTSLKIADGVTEIGDSAFSGCNLLTALTIPDSVTRIGPGAFAYCSQLPALVIPNSVAKIGSDAFFNCLELKTIDLTAFDGSSVPSLGRTAFFSLPDDAKFIFATQAALDAFAADSGWSEYSQYFEVATGND